MAKQEFKSWYTSKMMWVNILAVVGGICTAVSADLAVGGTITGLGILNIILRYITKSKLY